MADEPVLRRASAIGFWPPAQPGTTDLAEPGMFASNDGKVINWVGENYYKACGDLVRDLGNDGTTSCVKPLDHPSEEHEDYAGQTRAIPSMDYHFSDLSLEEAVGQAIGAASMCWETPDGAGTFQSERAEQITMQLLERIHQAGPIYG